MPHAAKRVRIHVGSKCRRDRTQAPKDARLVTGGICGKMQSAPDLCGRDRACRGESYPSNLGQAGKGVAGSARSTFEAKAVVGEAANRNSLDEQVR